MIRFSAKTTKILAAITLLGGAIAGVNCNKSNGGNTSNGVGLMRLALTTGGVTINSVHYKIVKSDMTAFVPPIEGDINTMDPNSTPSVEHSVPASSGDSPSSRHDGRRRDDLRARVRALASTSLRARSRASTSTSSAASAA